MQENGRHRVETDASGAKLRRDFAVHARALQPRENPRTRKVEEGRADCIARLT